MAIAESKKNIYHFRRLKFHFAHAPNKNKDWKWQLKSGLTIKRFDSLDWTGRKILPMGKNMFSGGRERVHWEQMGYWNEEAFVQSKHCVNDA